MDGFMNIAMEQSEEYVDGQMKARYGDCFIRGNNGKHCWSLQLRANEVATFFQIVLYISTAKIRK